MDYAQNGLIRMPIHGRTRSNMYENTKLPHLGQSSLASLLEHLPIGVMVFNSQQCLFWNREVETIFENLDFKPTMNSSLSDVIEVLQVQEEIDTVHLYMKKISNAGARIFDLEFSVIASAENLTFFLIRDVSHRQQDQESIEQLDRLFVVGELAAGIAHEIRNPLASIRGFTQMIQGTKDPESIDVYTDIMLEELDRINELVEELLHLARPRTQQFVEADLIEILDTVIFLLNSQAVLKNCSVQFVDREQVISLLISCQPNKLKQVFINIVKNAVEASPVGGTVYVSLKKTASSIVVKIKDEGPGLPAKYTQVMGRKFFTTKESGTGLGLMISQNILREHNGFLSIENRPRRGASAQVVLPVSEYSHPHLEGSKSGK